MAIHFVTGRPGAGKGLYCMKLIESEIRATPRKIVTNFPILQDELGEVLHDKFGDSYDLVRRLHLIEEKNELRNFYRIRGQEHDEEESWLEAETDKKGKPVAYDITGAFKSGGVFYLLDEIHLVFGARDWQEMGRAVMYYASQHRKLGDTVILVTQCPKHVDAQFRNIAQDFTVLRNHGLEKIGWFKQPDVFSRKTYMNLPTDGGRQEPQETSHFKLDLDWANCYETDRGVGIESGIDGAGGADKGQDRRSGIRWYWLIGGIVLLAVGAFFAVTRGVGYFFREAADSAIKVVSPMDANTTAENNSSLARVRAALAARLGSQNLTSNQVGSDVLNVQSEVVEKSIVPVISVTNFVEGFAFTKYRGKIQAHFMLSSGRVIQSGDGSVVEISSKRIVEKDGSVFKFRPSVHFDPRELMQTP